MSGNLNMSYSQIKNIAGVLDMLKKYINCRQYLVNSIYPLELKDTVVVGAQICIQILPIITLKILFISLREINLGS